MENHAVRPIHVKLLSLHDNQAFFQVAGEEGHRIGLMVDCNEVAIVREQGTVLRIVTGYRKAENLREHAGLLIDGENSCGIISCV